jgi:hypothetical protein
VVVLDGYPSGPELHPVRGRAFRAVQCIAVHYIAQSLCVCVCVCVCLSLSLSLSRQHACLLGLDKNGTREKIETGRSDTGVVGTPARC